MNYKLSALLVACNEEKQIDECLSSIQFADEIIVVLDKCVDETEKIARRYTRKIYKGSWNLEGERRNFGIKKCSHEWIFEIDADERVPVLLQKEIRLLIKKSIYDYHLIDVNNFIGKKFVKYGWGAYFGKSSYPGLFRKNAKIWGNERVHPKLILKGKKGDNLNHRLTHFYCKNISDMIKKLDSYSSARAFDLLYSNSNETSVTNIRRIFSRFWKCFVLRRGYKEKYFGLMIGFMASLYPLLSYVKYKFLKK